MHPQMFTQIYQVVHSSVDLFAIHLNHKVPLYVSPVPVLHAWDMDALNVNWSGLTAYTYPPMALLHRAIHVRQYNCLIIVMAPGWPGMPWFLGPSAALNRDPTSVTSVNNISTSTPGV